MIYLVLGEFFFFFCDWRILGADVKLISEEYQDHYTTLSSKFRFIHSMDRVF